MLIILMYNHWASPGISAQTNVSNGLYMWYTVGIVDELAGQLWIDEIKMYFEQIVTVCYVKFSFWLV